MAGYMAKTSDQRMFERRLIAAKWRPAPEAAGQWRCPRCSGINEPDDKADTMQGDEEAA